MLKVKNSDYETLDVTSLHIKPIFFTNPHGDMDERETFRPILPVQFESDIVRGRDSKTFRGQKIGIPITKLSRNQEINIQFDVQKGIGKMHAKWSPVSIATFQPDPQIKIDDSIEPSLAEKTAIYNSCPTKVFDWLIQVFDCQIKVFELQHGIFEAAYPDRCIYCNECIKTAEALNMKKLRGYIQIGTILIDVGKKKDRHIFTVESVGGMPALQIVKKAMVVLREKLKNIEGSIN